MRFRVGRKNYKGRPDEQLQLREVYRDTVGEPRTRMLINLATMEELDRRLTRP